MMRITVSLEHAAAVAAIVIAVMTTWIAVVAHRFSVRATRLQTERELTDRFMNMNWEMYSNPDVASLYQRTRHPGKAVDYLRVLALTRYRLSLLSLVWRAEREEVLPGAYSRFGFDDWVELLTRTSAEALREALTAQGYDRAFIDQVKRVQKERGLESYDGGVRSGSISTNVSSVAPSPPLAVDWSASQLSPDSVPDLA
ncbi:MAG: hypothetical protein IPF98_22545 [Gemmatimonadetes bacterium]|nr:hypothetical protein [Gemmatimonadota bacterium]